MYVFPNFRRGYYCMHVFPQYAILCHAITTILDFQIHVKFANLDSKLVKVVLENIDHDLYKDLRDNSNYATELKTMVLNIINVMLHIIYMYLLAEKR